MCVRQAHQSQEVRITADGRHAFMGPVNFGHQRSCLGIGYSFLEGNNSVLNMIIWCVRTMTIKCQSFNQILGSRLTTVPTYRCGSNSSNTTSFRGASD